LTHRILFIDIVKGYGILLVVFGHNWFVLSQKGELFNIIFSFHIPLFFFISGVFFNHKKSLWTTVTSKSDSLLKPYFATLILLGFYNIAVKKVPIIKYTTGMLYGNGLTIPWEPLWFLTHLFIMSLAMWLLFFLFNRLELNETNKDLLMFVLFSAGVYVIKFAWMKNIYIFNQEITVPGLPFSMDILPVTLFFFYLGYRFKDKAINFKPSPPGFLISFTVFAALHYFLNYTIDFNLRIYDNFFISTIESLCGIYIICSISYYTTSSSTTSKLLSLAGQSSLFILIFHGFIQRKSFSVFANTLGLNHEISAILSFVAAGIVPIFMYRMIKRNRLLSTLYLPVRFRNDSAGKDNLS